MENKDWDGEGIPPIGSICESTAYYLTKGFGSCDKWSECKIIGYYNEFVWIKDIGNSTKECDEFISVEHNNEFRVIDRRTDKDKFVSSFIENSDVGDEELAGHMYEQGFRNLEK